MDWSVSSAVLITDGVAAIVGWAGALLYLRSLEAACAWRVAAGRPFTTSASNSDPRTADCASSDDGRSVHRRPILAKLAVNRTTRTGSSRPRRACCRGSRGARYAASTVVALLFSRCHFISWPRLGIAAGSVCETVKLWLLQRGVFVLHLGVEHESRSIAALTAAAQQKR